MVGARPQANSSYTQNINCVTVFIYASVLSVIQEIKGHSGAQKEGLSLHPEVKYKTTSTPASSDAKKTQVGDCNCQDHAMPKEYFIQNKLFLIVY